MTTRWGEGSGGGICGGFVCGEIIMPAPRLNGERPSLLESPGLRRRKHKLSSFEFQDPAHHSYLNGSVFSPYSPLDLDLLSTALPSPTLGLRPSSPAGENEGKWPKLGKPGKEARREEGSPGARRREKPKWFAKLGWWKDARPCLESRGEMSIVLLEEGERKKLNV